MKLEKLKRAHPGAEVQLWAEDETRLGLKPVIRRVWAPVGDRPVARFKRGYKWTYLYGFVRPQSGEVFWLILCPRSTWSCSRWRSMRSSPKRWKQARRSACFWWWIKPGGTQEVRSRSPKGYTWSSYPRARLSYNRRRGCGR